MDLIDKLKSVLDEYDKITKTEYRLSIKLLKKKVEGTDLIVSGPCLNCGKYNLDYELSKFHQRYGNRWFFKRKKMSNLHNLIYENGLKFYFNDFSVLFALMKGYFCEDCIKTINKIGKELKKEAKIKRNVENLEWDKRRQQIHEQQIKCYSDIFNDEKSSLYNRLQALKFIFTYEDCEKLQKLSYEDFLNTKYWDLVRRYKLKRSGFKCELCNSNGKTLNVHHKTYDNHGMEHDNLEDLIVLCRNCHEKFHDVIANPELGD